MGWTKRQFVTQAFEEIGLAGYVFDLGPEQLQSALRNLDSMMAGWNAKGIRVNYPLPGSPGNSDLDAETGVPDAANEAIYLNLAARIGPAYGKEVSLGTIKNAKEAYNSLITRFVRPDPSQLPADVPLGAGNKPWRYDDPFTGSPTPGPISSPNNEVAFNGD